MSKNYNKSQKTHNNGDNKNRNNANKRTDTAGAVTLVKTLTKSFVVMENILFCTPVYILTMTKKLI